VEPLKLRLRIDRLGTRKSNVKLLIGPHQLWLPITMFQLDEPSGRPLGEGALLPAEVVVGKSHRTRLSSAQQRFRNSLNRLIYG